MPGPWDVGADAPPNAVRFTPTYADTLAAYRLAFRPKWRLWAGYLVLIVAILASAGDLSHMSLDARTALSLGPIVLVAALFALWRAVLIPIRIRRIYDQQAALSDEYVVWADDGGIHVRTAHSSTDAPYHRFIKRRQNANVILLYQSDAMFNFFPRRLLTDEQGRRLEERLADIPLRR